jgi:quinol monooxygenase YgiN
MGTIRTFATMTLRDKQDLDEVVGIFRTFIRDVQEKDEGVLTYHYFIDDDGDRPVISVFEEYADAKAHLEHFAHMDMQAAGRLMELVELADPHYYGEPSDEERELLAGFGNVHYHRPLISKEEPVAQR